MTEPEASANPYKRREVSVDGISYSLDSGRKLHPTVRPTPPAKPQAKPSTADTDVPAVSRPHKSELPDLALPKVIHKANQHKTLIQLDNDLTSEETLHPHLVSHPSLPLPGAQNPIKVRRSFLRQVVIGSFSIKHDSRASNAILISTVLSPFYWVLVATPWLIRSFAYLNDQPSQQWYSSLQNFVVNLSFGSFAVTSGIVAAGLGVIWLVRHILMLVSFGLELRKIDNRPATWQQFWWQSAAKSSRLAGLAIIDLVCSLAIFTLLGLAFFHQLPGQIESSTTLQTYYFNAIGVVSIMLLLILAIHRPLSRLMLTATNQPLSFLVTRSYDMIWQSRGLAFIAGIVWSLIAGITAVLSGAIIWAAVNYGLSATFANSTGRIGLVVLAAGLLYLTLASFAVWSQGYWSLSYHWLGHRVKQSQISALFVTEPHPKSPRRAIFHICLLMLIYIIIVSLVIFLIKTPVSNLIEYLRVHFPGSINDLLPKA